MKFSSNEDIEAPIKDAFALFTDFDQFERSALRRSADVRRIDTLGQNGVGMAWNTQFKLRGKERKIDAEMVEYCEPENFCLQLQSEEVTALAHVELMPLSKGRTRASVSVELKPISLAGRLLVQSLRLGKARLDKKFKKKAGDFVRNLERDYQAKNKA
ncbi:SRPBCC family protein [Planktotalea sp.]|uniref:SRPBCC family protein n=1 Tax=Planktotalea sp. TaxID=2029877 RepID=UPI003D6AD985